MLWLAIAWCCAAPLAAAVPVERELTLGTNSSLAHSNGSHNGSHAHIDCILNSMRQPYQVQFMPWRRAQQEVLKGSLDGYYTALPTPEVKPYATLSEPLVLENWYWFWRPGQPAPDRPEGQGARIGVMLGSHQATLLEEQGRRPYAEVNSLEQLIKLLVVGRIDALLADKEHFEAAAGVLGVSAHEYQYRFYRYVPLGVYFGRPFLSQSPGFLPRFNRAIYPCAPEGFALSEYERTQIEARVLPLVHAWRQRPRLQAAVAEQNRRHAEITMTDILAWDSLWIDEFQRAEPRFSLQVLNNPLSQELRVLKHEARGLLTEIIVTDKHGLNVGVSDMTSDYWQGNEPKYQQVFARPESFWLIENVEYDESTARFQVQLSVPLYNLDGTQAIGTLTVGVDIERALATD